MAYPNIYGKTLACATILALSACGPVTTDAQDAAIACRGIGISAFHDDCMSNYVNNRQSNRDAQWNMIGASLMSYRPARQTTCMNLGGIVTCQ